MESLYQQILASAPAAHAQYMFGVHVFGVLLIFALVVAVVAGITAWAEGEFTEGSGGTLFVSLIASLILLGFVSTNYCSALEIENAPEHWAAEKVAKAVHDALN